MRARFALAIPSLWQAQRALRRVGEKSYRHDFDRAKRPVVTGSSDAIVHAWDVVSENRRDRRSAEDSAHLASARKARRGQDWRGCRQFLGLNDGDSVYLIRPRPAIRQIACRRAERSAAHRREAGAHRRLLRHHGAPARGDRGGAQRAHRGDLADRRPWTYQVTVLLLQPERTNLTRS